MRLGVDAIKDTPQLHTVYDLLFKVTLGKCGLERCVALIGFQKQKRLFQSQSQPVHGERDHAASVRVHALEGIEERFHPGTDGGFAKGGILLAVRLDALLQYGVGNCADGTGVKSSALILAKADAVGEEPGIGAVEPALDAGDGAADFTVLQNETVHEITVQMMLRLFDRFQTQKVPLLCAAVFKHGFNVVGKLHFAAFVVFRGIGPDQLFAGAVSDPVELVDVGVMALLQRRIAGHLGNIRLIEKTLHAFKARIGRSRAAGNVGACLRINRMRKISDGYEAALAVG